MLTATAAAGGVVNSYAQPDKLGRTDGSARGCAQRALGMELFARPVVVVNAGTAVTIDALDADGLFRGGVIVPGLRLMLRALAEHTAGLKAPPGSYRDYPTNTGDALYSGAVQAITGAIGEMRARLAGDAGEVKCLLAGGAADDIAPHLGGPVEVVENLVLEGVLRCGSQ